MDVRQSWEEEKNKRGIKCLIRLMKMVNQLYQFIKLLLIYIAKINVSAYLPKWDSLWSLWPKK